ncbi:MAG: hypothetical protein BWY87_01193 [Deltaproteobacteria bacterium ADurb.Bin510]|nr:MAG: hypothetical protein BWY87_01193 [Deltaproteobacteria bacterium ADurb.Bin510]
MGGFGVELLDQACAPGVPEVGGGRAGVGHGDQVEHGQVFGAADQACQLVGRVFVVQIAAEGQFGQFEVVFDQQPDCLGPVLTQAQLQRRGAAELGPAEAVIAALSLADVVEQGRQPEGELVFHLAPGRGFLVREGDELFETFQAVAVNRVGVGRVEGAQVRDCAEGWQSLAQQAASVQQAQGFGRAGRGQQLVHELPDGGSAKIQRTESPAQAHAGPGASCPDQPEFLERLGLAASAPAQGAAWRIERLLAALAGRADLAAGPVQAAHEFAFVAQAHGGADFRQELEAELVGLATRGSVQVITRRDQVVGRTQQAFDLGGAQAAGRGQGADVAVAGQQSGIPAQAVVLAQEPLFEVGLELIAGVAPELAPFAVELGELT